MRDNVSIIFATIILTFLIVILPMFSILDRQDSMSYNLVLSETTKFVDDVRSNGFITEEDYLNYVTSLSATGNTYKVVLEAYRKTLIPSLSEPGKYDEEKKLYNTQDIVDVITGERGDEEEKDANRRDNIFIFDINDEFYVHVYNTNMTAGSMMYNMIVDNVNSKVIDVTYGGLVNNVNWELYTKLKNETIVQPTVTLSVPTNLEGKFNIVQTSEKGDLANLQCAEISGLDDLFAGAYELCTDIIKDEIYKYQYYLDEKNDAGEYVNKTINIFAELRGVDMLDVATTADKTEYIEIEKVYNLKYRVYNDTNIEKAIVEKYIHLNGMTAEKIDIVNFEKKNNRYYLQIKLTGVDRESQANFSQIASISILPGLGKNKEHELTTGAESVKLELTIKGGEIEAGISGPYNWKKFLKTNIIEEALMPYVFAEEEIFFKVQFSEAANVTAQTVRDKLKDTNAIIFKRRETSGTEATYSKTDLNLECYTAQDMAAKGVTVEEDTVVVKIKYPTSAIGKYNELILRQGWLTGMVQTSTGEFLIYNDAYGPNKPVIDYEGILGKNDWYVSDVKVVTYSTSDRGTFGGSGIYRNLLNIAGPLTFENVEENAEVVLTENGEYSINVITEDYVGKTSDSVSETIRIDKKAPFKPTIKAVGKKGSKGAAEWFIEDPVEVTIVEDRGADGSGYDKTTYTIQGTKTVYETTYSKPIVLEESGIYTITATTYDRAGNTSTSTVTIKLDRGAPPVATIEILKGLKHDDANDWYYTDVKLRINVNITLTDTHKNESKYELYKDGVIIEDACGKFKGTIKDLEITYGTGVYTLKVYTYTTSDKETVSEHTIKIDKEGPAVPKVIISGEQGTNGWYTKANVRVKLDEDDDKFDDYTYTYLITDQERNFNINGTFTKTNKSVTIMRDDRFYLIVTAEDKAGNSTTYEQEINIDSIAPTCDVVISGKGRDPIYYDGEEDADDKDKTFYYNSLVKVSYINGIDLEPELDGAAEISGVDRVDISDPIIDTDEGTVLIKDNVTVAIYDKAGNSTTYTRKIVVDRQIPDAATIRLAGTAADESITGVDTFKSEVEVYLTPGNDTNYHSVKYTISGPTGFTTLERTITSTTETYCTKLTENGFYTITVETYDKAGNYSVSTKVVYINTVKPGAPEILMVNDVYIGGKNYMISDDELVITVQVVPTEIGSITINITGSGTSITRTIDSNDSIITEVFTLNAKNNTTYYISATQKNLAGVSSNSSNTVTYKYEK